MKLILNPEYGLYEKNGESFCDSLQVAETFEKRHDHVLRDIEAALQSFEVVGRPKFGVSNYIKTNYKSVQNKSLTKYLLAKDGFTYLTMGYTGNKAVLFKLDYINRFNAMENFIKSLLAAKLAHPAWTEAIMNAYDEPKSYHFSNEANMINRIVLGMDAKTFRRQHGIEDGESIRPYLNDGQIKAVETLQRIDVGLLEIETPYERRKEVLTNSFNKRRLKLVG